MGKVAKLKKRDATVHSRAHRRNASPPPKDLAVKAPVAEETEYKPWLHNARHAGISKKKKSKQMSRQQKVRQQRALEKADANLDKLATKVQQSKARARKVQARAAAWEELNGDAAVVEGKKVVTEGGGDDEGWEDEEEDGGKAIELDVGLKDAEAEPQVVEAVNNDGEADKVAFSEPEEDEEL